MDNIAGKDLNLLMVFEALALERNVSRAASRLHLSQSAVSHALGRLRDAFGDDLFVRAPRGVVPTARATALQPRILQVLEAVRGVYRQDEEFTPKAATGQIRLGSTEAFEHIALPKLIPLLTREAPNLVLNSRMVHGKLPKEDMEQGVCDVAIAGFFGDLPEGFYKRKLYDDGFVCVVRKDHPRIKKAPTLDEYVAEGHLLISPQGDLHGLVDRQLEKKKKSRKVVAGISNFLTPGSVVAGSDLILTLPSRMADLHRRLFQLNIYEIPLSVPPITMLMTWHERTHRDPLHQWFREKLVASV